MAGNMNVQYLVVIILTVGIIKVINSYVLLFSPLLELASEKAAQAQSWTLTVNLAKCFSNIVFIAKENFVQ